MHALLNHAMLLIMMTEALREHVIWHSIEELHALIEPFRLFPAVH